MTSIIGYTRAPFNLYCSIAPVKKLYQQEVFAKGKETTAATTTTTTGAASGNNLAIDKKQPHSPNFYRIFTRDSMSSGGIIEIIKNKQSLFLRNDETKAATINNNSKEHRCSRVGNNIAVHNTTTLLNEPINQPQRVGSEYSVCLSIELENKQEFDSLFKSNRDNEFVASVPSYTNIERVMESLSELAYNLTMKFVHVLELLKKLLLYQKQYQFMSCIDKQQKTLKVYFPKDLTDDVTGTYVWLKEEIGIDVSTQQNWHLVCIKDKDTPHDQKTSADNVPTNKSSSHTESFDGKAYFEDIHKFIDQVDALIQSNGLFSHPGNEENQ